MDAQILDYASILLVVVGLCISYKVFVTPEMLEKRLKEKRILIESECSKMFTTKEEMQIERKELLEAIDTKYIERTVYEEANKRIDERLAEHSRQLEKIANNQESIKDLIIQKLIKD